jgi:hypothetical protein
LYHHGTPGTGVSDMHTATPYTRYTEVRILMEPIAF